MGFCVNCGAALSGERFCRQCGHPVDPTGRSAGVSGSSGDSGSATTAHPAPGAPTPTSVFAEPTVSDPTWGNPAPPVIGPSGVGAPAWSAVVDPEPPTVPTQAVGWNGPINTGGQLTFGTDDSAGVTAGAGDGRSRRTALIVAAGLCLALLVGAAVWFIALRPGADGTAQIPPDPSVSTAPSSDFATSEPTDPPPTPTSPVLPPVPVTSTEAAPTTAATVTETVIVTPTTVADPTVTAPTVTSGAVVPPPPTTATPTTATPTTATPTTATTTAPPPDPMGGPREPIACAPGYIVQVASEGDAARLETRVAEIRAAGRLPSTVKWATVDESCAIFSGQANSAVLYAGPFATPGEGCAARLAAPADAFIKGTTPETATEYISCLCPATVSELPVLDRIGQSDVWVGELQRVLGSRLDYGVGELDNSTWGIYTQATAEAVGRFRSDSGLPAGTTVDAGTWKALQLAQC